VATTGIAVYEATFWWDEDLLLPAATTGAFSAQTTDASTVVPLPELERTWKAPPTNRIRSLMLTRPKPSLIVRGSNPTPSSETVSTNRFS
jgi:hypothetical protein